MATRKEVQDLYDSNYATDFINTVLTDVGEGNRKFPDVKIIFYEDIAVDENGDDAGVRGLFNPDSNEVTILDYKHETVKGLKIALRHELLHFILYHLGWPYKDTDKDFLQLAIKYHACAYGMIQNLGINLDDATISAWAK